MTTLTSPDPRGSIFAQPHEIVSFIDALQREFPDAPRSRIAEALVEGREHPAVTATRDTLREFIRLRLVARKYSVKQVSRPISPAVREADRVRVGEGSLR